MASTIGETDPRVTRSRARVLDAVASLLVEKGVRGVTVEAVMARSGVARATVYRHWPTRQALVLAGLRHLLPPPVPQTTVAGTLSQRLTSVLGELARQMEVEPWAHAVPALLDAARLEPEIATVTAQFVADRQAPIRAVLQEAVEAGSLPGLDIGIALAQLTGPLVYRRLITSEPLDEELCAKVVEDFVRSHTSHR
ncbi:TetR/AcrR family transcriptional regulator [Actinomadura scrupuli]|uniref:TetR/AcrR family transcriptional regulator n=1 Tax=Actinomadura scrupuli TaxID=559629 RepID=UPI003D96B93F